MTCNIGSFCIYLSNLTIGTSVPHIAKGRTITTNVVNFNSMIQILRKLSLAKHNRTTYRVGLLQAKAYRILKSTTTQLLKPLGISTIEWAFLGLLHDRGSLRSKAAALELGVEPPFITVLVTSLKNRGLVSETKEANDTRAKSLQLTEEGRVFVDSTEKIVREGMRSSIKGVHLNDLLGYLAVLETIVTNGTE